MGHAWRPIEPLHSDWQSLANSELPAIRTVWAGLKEAMGEQAASRLQERMLTEWSIETGMVEDLYRWDRDVTETLLAHGVRAGRIPDGASKWPPELVAQVIRDQVEVGEGLFSFVKAERPLGTSFVHELHAHLLRSVPRDFDLGKWKSLPNHVRLAGGGVHEYCPPEHVAAEMDRLLQWNSQYEAEQVPVEIRAAWLHHRFTQIHPYPDGNGRTARALASLLFVKDGLFPLIIRREEKNLYLDALEAADCGDVAPLTGRFRAMQRREVVKMSAGVPLAPPENGPLGNLEDVLKRVSEKLVYTERAMPERWASLPGKVAALHEEMSKQVDTLAQRLTETFAAQTGFRFNIAVNDGDTHGLKTENLDYQPRYARIDKNVCLRISTPQPWHIACAIHETGPRTNGLAACVVYLAPPKAEQRAALQPPSEYFLIPYPEPLPDLKARFSKWLEKQLIRTLDLWRQQL